MVQFKLKFWRIWRIEHQPEVISCQLLLNKFKKCISCCKQAALTVKTATGITRFQEDRGYGKWFNALFEVVKTRDSCQPELALEPSSSGSSNKSFDDTDNSREDGSDGGLFVPKSNVMKVQSSKHKLDSLEK